MGLRQFQENAMWKELTNHEKMLSRFSVVLIGRLAVAERFAGQGIGSEILDFIKLWFLSEENKTGCRLAIVDAKNKAEILKFYEKNGSRYLFKKEIDEDLCIKPEMQVYEVGTQQLLAASEIVTGSDWYHDDDAPNDLNEDMW